MPPLTNPRHERFVQALFEGETADAAYVIAGYKPNDGNCIRLKGNERVMARLAELQTQAAKASEVTVQSLLTELEQARSRADSLEQLSAAVKAIDLKAKVSGLLVNRVEVGDPGSFAELETPQDVTEALIKGYGLEGYRFTDDERDQLTEMLVASMSEVMEFLVSCKVRPRMSIVGTSPADLRDQERRANRRQQNAAR